MMDDNETTEREVVSKSQIKRELLALQQLAERLLELSPEEWGRLGFTPLLLEALQESRRVKGNSAQRRQVRLLGKLLRDEDTAKVKALFENIDGRHTAESRRLHRLEKWRDRLILEGESAINDLVLNCPTADLQRIRQLLHASQRERAGEKPPVAQRKLFKYLKELPLK
ncbi:MAG: DUF615 domain-containing protein [Chromatiaceae bacterium]|nr:DUF615 domain-containing protein [Chromatiaceae bacterium]